MCIWLISFHIDLLPILAIDSRSHIGPLGGSLLLVLFLRLSAAKTASLTWCTTCRLCIMRADLSKVKPRSWYVERGLSNDKRRRVEEEVEEADPGAASSGASAFGAAAPAAEEEYAEAGDGTEAPAADEESAEAGHGAEALAGVEEYAAMVDEQDRKRVRVSLTLQMDLMLKPSDTIAYVKAKIHDKTGIPPAQQGLTLTCKPFPRGDHVTLADAGVVFERAPVATWIECEGKYTLATSSST